MEDNDDIKWLYGKLKAKGYDIGSEDEFKSSLANSDDRKWYYDKAKGMGLDMGSMDDFESMYAPKQPAPKQPAAKPAPAAPANEVKPQQPQQSLQPQPKKNEAMTPLQRQAFAASAGRIAARAKAGVAATNERLDNIKQYGIGPNDGETHEGGYKVNPQTNELEQTYITPTGTRYTNKAAADAESRQYRQMTSQALGLDMDDKQVARAQEPADAAVAALWNEAEKQYASDRDKNANDVYGGNPWLNGGREMRMVNAGLNAHKNKVAQMTRFDLQKMMDSAWERAGKQMTSSLYAQMQKEYPWATDKQLRTSAEKMARQLSDNAVYKYAVAKNTPKSTLEYFAKTAADMNLLGNVAKGLARSEAGTTGDMAAYEAAMGEYGKSHRIAQIGGTVAGMMFDPTTYIGGSVGSFLGKGALNFAGRAYLRNAATGVGARLLGANLKGRALAGAAGGIGNLGTYEGLKEVESQFLHGGHINAQTGENEGYSAGDVLKSTAHGAILGAATGTVSPLLGNVADKTVKATTSTAGKVGIRAGELAVSTVAEGTIFSVPEWISGNSDAMDVWTDNLSMMLGFKAQHAVKSAPRVIAGLRPIAEPKTMAERNHNRMSFVEKLRKQLDASPRDMAFTKEEREELAKYGYGDLAMLFTRTPKQDNTEAKPADSKVGLPEARAEALHKQWLEDHPEFDGYEAMERLVQDPSVSQAARAKAYYLLTGRLLPMGSITGWTREEDENGNIYVKSVTANGEIVTSRYCRDEASAKAEEDKIKRQAELNSIDVGERYTETQADKEVMKAAIDAVAPGADYETVMRNYQAVKEGDADAKANYGEMMDAIDKFMEQNKDMADGSRPEAIRNNINEEYGVEVDEAIRKEPSKRTEQESKAVQDYIERLFPEQAKERTAQSPEEAEASAMYDSGRQLWGEVEKGDETAKAKMDEVAARLKEANDLCEEAFGADADMRMAEMKEDAWALLNNPELSEAQQDAVLYYINAKAAMDGVTDASNESADNKRQEVENTVRMRTHRDTGMVQPATMKVKNDDGTDKKVYIVKGNLTTFDDGTVDVRNSDQSIIICETDATTGENRYRFTSPDQIFRVGDGVDPQSEVETASAAIQAEHDAMLGKDAQNSGESVPETAEGEQNPTEMWLHGKLGVKEYLLQVGYFPEWVNAQTDEALLEEANHFARLNPNAKVHRAKYNSHEEELAAEQAGKDVEPNEELTSQSVPGEEKSEEGNESTALSRIPVDEKTGEPMFEQADGETALAAIGELTGGNEANTEAIINAQVEQANKELEALKKKQPKKTAPKLAGSPMAMIKAQQEADANYNAAMEQYNAQLDAAQKKAEAWNGMAGLMRDKAAAKLEEEKRIAAEQETEQTVQTEPGAKVETEPNPTESVPEAAEPVAAETAKPVEAEPAEDNKPAEAAPKTEVKAEQSAEKQDVIPEEGEKVTQNEAPAAEDNGSYVNPEVQNHDWDQYKKGDIFDYEGWKMRYVFTERDKNGRVIGPVVEQLDEKGNPIGRESVPPLMFLEHYKKVEPAAEAKTEKTDAQEGELDNAQRIERRREKILSHMGDKYSLSDERADNGEAFIQNEEGSTNLAKIPDEIFDRIGIAPVPFKMTETMGWHVYDHHHIEAKLQSVSDAVDFVLSIINNVDHVRLGRDNSYIFSVENKRDKIGRRAVTIMINSKTGEFMGIKTSGYESINKLHERPLLWERGADAAPEDVATPTITTIEPQQGDERTSRTKGQSNVSSEGKVNDITPKTQGKSEKSSANEGETLLSEKIKEASADVNTEPTEAQKEHYTITPTTYTNKKGKTSDVSLLKFNDELTKEQERAINELAREKLGDGRFAKTRGWKDRESGGWMFRSEKDARKAAEMVGNAEAVENAQPLTAQEMRDAVQPTKAATIKPANKVEIADLAEKPAKADTTKPEEGRKLVISDEMKADEDVLRELLGIGEEEIDGTMFRDPDAMTAAERRKVFAVGVNYALGYIDQGFVSFTDFAKAMTSRLGYKIKPWLKSFYEGAKRIPGYENIKFTPSDEVDSFDVENFDNPQKSSIFAKAEMEAAESKAKAVADKANTELKEIRNEKRKEFDKQAEADTAALASEAEAVASEAEANAETSRDRRAVTESAERVDETLDKTNDRLALLGYYKADQVEKDYNEATGYMRNAEKKAVKDAANLASSLIDDLGLNREEATHTTGKNGKRKAKPLAVANIAPAGGDITIHLPLAEGRELYINIQLEPVAAKGVTGYGSDNLEVNGIMWRVDNPNSTGYDRYGHNEWMPANVTYQKLLERVQRAVYKYIPQRSDVADGEYKIGEKVQYSPNGRDWYDAVVAQLGKDEIVLDTGHAPVMWVQATKEQVRHKAAPKFDVDAAVKKAKDDMSAKLEQVKDKIDAKILSDQIAQRDKYIDELDRRVRDGERTGTLAGMKNVDLPGTLVKCMGERDALEEALDNLHNQPSSKPSAESIADNPQSWVGKTFTYNGMKLVCDEVDRGRASFDNKTTFIAMVSDVSTVQGWLKSGKMKVEGANPVEPKKENIFQKAERIANEEQTKRELDAAPAEPKTISEEGIVKRVMEHPLFKRQVDNNPDPGAARRKMPDETGSQPAPNNKVKPEQKVGDLFAGSLFDNEQNNGLERNREAVRTEGLQADNNKVGQGRSVGGNGKGAPQRSGRTDGSRTDGSERTRGEVSQSDIRPDGRLQGLGKNARNNHSERGVDHAPKTVTARYNANVAAIKLAHELLESGQPATPEQMSVLRQYSGWGGLGSAFNGGNDWKQRERNKELRELLGEKAYDEAVLSANSAYYTPAYVVDTLWDIARQLGFKGGKILEGSAGIGNIIGQIPMDMNDRSDIHAIEIDSTSGGILSLLYPDAKVDIKGFEQTHIPNGSVDLAITNVPFVTGMLVKDKTGDGDLSNKFHNIHDFCIAKNVRKLREGGLGIFITSNGTLDNSQALRDWVVNEGDSDFIGAFRMHNETFGGTPVTSDIIVIRKRVNGKKSANAIDVSMVSAERASEFNMPGESKVKPVSMDYNKYFIEHPDHMAGEMLFGFEKGNYYRPSVKGLYPVSGKDQGKMLADFVKSFTEETGGSMETPESEKFSFGVDASAEGKRLGEMYLLDGKLVTAGFGNIYYPLEVNDKKIKGHTKQECFNAYAAIKTALADVMKYQTENEGDAGLQPLIDKLNKAYDAFVSTYGHFNKNNQLAWLRNDVDFPNVFSLEDYEEQGDGKGGVTKTYGKADVMKHRVVEKETEPHPENVKDGVVVSMFKNGRIDVPYIAEQLGKSEADVKREIINGGFGFENPVTRGMEVSYKYLSGNVREKLRQAEANNENGEYAVNIKALQGVLPMSIPAHLIDFTLGSSWLSPKLYEDYVKDRTDLDVKFTAVGGSWYMDEPYYVNKEKNRAMGVTSEKLHKTVFGHELIEAAIQNKSIIVSVTERHWNGTTETIVDRDATAACASKIDEIRQDFKDWMRQKMQSEAELSAQMEAEYNDRFNNYVPMRIPDDFVPEYFSGATHKFKMRPHQGKAIVRGTMQPVMLAHEVGTGKTYTLISTAMEMRRLGTARKPMIVVQNATVGQFVASAKELYPNAKILTLEDGDRNAEGRKNFYAKIKYNDWDMIVVPQSTFERIPDSEERQMAFIQSKIDEKLNVLEQMKKADSSERNAITRQAKKEIDSLQAELKALSEEVSTKRSANDEKKRAVAKHNAAVKAQEMLEREVDDVENFDDMGIDALLVDEAHEYKHLGFATAMQRGVKGVDPSYSKKSQGVYLKAQAVLQKSKGRNVVFATGTPISNTAAEIWTFMRYLMPADTMKEYGIYYFDDFVRNFGNIQQMPEFNTSGKFKEVNRFAGYVNLPELVRIWSGVADTVLTKDQAELVEKIPDMEGGKAQDIYLPQTRALRSVMKYVRDELERFDNMSGKEKKQNSHIPLTMYGIAQGAAVDARLVVSDAEDDPNSKTNEAVRQTLRSLKETDGYKGTVAIFADHYQNKSSGFNLYEDIKQKLIAQGVPESEIVVMKPGMTVKKKLDIFDKVNHGEVRVILGSTATLGTGVNIQERLHTLIHLDAPNRPMDYTQRNGRILRQGNLHKEWNKPVRVLRFGVEDSLDVTAYQRLKTKGSIADSIMEGDKLMADSMNNRVLEEEEDVFGDTVAQLSGSEYALLKNNAEKNVRKYESRKKQWEVDQTYIHNAKPKMEGQIKTAERRAEEAKSHLQAVKKAFPDGKTGEIIVGKKKFGSVEAMTDFIKEHNKKIADELKAMKENKIYVTRKYSLTLSIGGFNFIVNTELSREVTQTGTSFFSEVHRDMTYSCPELGLENVPVKQSLLRNALEDIAENVITGKDFEEQYDSAMRSVEHGKAELEQLKSREGKPFAYGKELEEAYRQLEEYTEAMKQELEEKEKKYAEMDASVEAATNVAVDDEDAEEEATKFRLLDDEDPKAKELEALPESELVPVYRNVQAFEDDALGSPMAFTDAVTGERRTLQGQKWNYSNPPKVELTDEQQRQLDELNKNGYIEVDGKKVTELKLNDALKFVKPKKGDAKLQYFLKKNTEDSGLWADYNPYDHAVETPLNTQFASAYKRPNLVVVRCLIPKSEIDEPYHADYAAKATGAHLWNNGRTLYLSRWSKIDKVLTREEEAKLIDEYWKANPQERDKTSHRDYNRFVPQVRRELEKMGYRFELNGKELTPEESRRLDNQNWENRDIIPGREGNVPFISNEDIARINAKMSGKWVGEPKEAMENAMVERVNELSERLHTPVRIVRTADEVAQLPTVRQRKMKGSFNPRTGEVTIVVPNNANLADIENTFVHEVVGHDGLRVLFPEGETFDNAMDELYRVSADGIKQTIDRNAQKMYDAEVDRIREKKRKEHEAKGEDASASYYSDMAEAHVEASKKKDKFRRDATEEYGSDLAGRIGEEGFERMSAEEQTFWGKLMAILQKALQRLLEGLKISGRVKFGDKEWAFVLHEAYKRKKNGGRPSVFDVADTVAMRQKTGFGEAALDEGHKKSAHSNEAALKHLEPTGVGHDAKLMQKRENAKKSLAEVAEVYKNTTETKGFLSDLCNALRLTRGLTGSGYGSFATPDGKVFTIRVSNHNVNTSRIGDEPMESIVIKTKRQPNRFKPQAGKTANEYVYFKEDIRNAPAGTLSKIAESISELLYTGEYQDKTGLAKHNPSPEIASDDDVMFRDGDDKDYEKAHARDIYERRVASGMYQMQEALQDSMLGLKEAMLDIVQAETGKRGHIEDIAGFENAYLGENRLSSTNLAEASEFNRRLWKPLLQEVARLAKTADERAELTDYMMAKHGLERNEVMAERFTQQVMNKAKASVAAMIVDAYNTKNKILAGNDQKAISAYNRKIAAIKAKFVAGNTLTDDEYVKLAADSFGVVADIKAAARTEAEAYVDANHDKYYKTQRKDYAGLTALTEESDVAKAEAEARNMVDAYENAHDTAELWARTNAVTGSTLAKSYQCGMIDRSTYNEIKGMYQNYIPLRGFDEKTSEEVYAYLNDRRSAFSAPIKTTKGRKSKADDPFANMESMAESAIAQGNRNVLVKQKFLNFVLAHPSDLVSVSDLWLGYDYVADEWKPLHPGDVANTFKIDVDDTPAEIERKMEIFEAVMEQKALADPAHFVKQKDRPDIPYRVVDTGKEREHQVIVKRNGKDYVLTVNGNPRAAQALNGQTNPDNDANGVQGMILHAGEWVNRELSAFYTTRNPDFIASNFMRDALYSNTMAWIKESPGYAWRFNRNFMKVNPAKMKTLFGRLRNGTLDMNDATDKLFYQFYTNGGETGYTVIRDIEELKNDIRRELKMNNGRLPLQKAWMWLGIRFDEYNRAVENCARFAAFVTSRQMRRSLERAVWDAKEISVNFNKKGSGAKFIEAVGETKSGKAASFVSGIGRSFYVFWNAAAQGTWNFGKNVSRNPKKALTGVALLFLLGAINAAVNSDDDEDTKNSYYNLPEYVRRSNIVFRLPWMKEQWISIPLPVEYRSIYGMGELAASAAFNDREHMTGGEVAGAMAAQVSQMLPIDMLEGGGGWRPFVPSAVKPMAEVLANKSWTGMPIYRDGEWNKNDPEWTKAFKSANEQLVGAAEWLNEISGGDKYTEGAIDINPAVVEYLLTGYFGGVANTVNRMVKTGETVMGEREYDPKSFIILNRLVKNGDERTENRALTNEYFRLRDEYEKTRNRLNHYEDDTDDGVFDYADKIAKLNSSPEYRRMEIFEDYGPDIESITQELKEPMPDEDRRELEQERTQLMRELVDEVNKSREKQ